MQFSVAATLAFAAQALAAVSFTSFPNNVQVGKPVTLTYSADDANSAVRIVLRRGPSNDLKDVATLTDSAKGGSYTWTPSSDLANGSDYALEIIQGSAFNYGSQFSISGGSASSSASSTPSGYSSLSTHMPIPLTTGGSGMSKTYGAGNATVAPTGTMPMPMNTASAATGSPNMANTTFSSATLSAPTGSNTGSGSGSGSGAGSTTSASGPASTGGSSANGAAHVGSSLALILGAVAAFAFLN